MLKIDVVVAVVVVMVAVVVVDVLLGAVVSTVAVGSCRCSIWWMATICAQVLQMDFACRSTPF